MMEDERVPSGIGMHIVKDCLIVPVTVELDDDSVLQLQKEILGKIQANLIKGVLIDVSALRVLDSYTFSILADTARMVSMLGAEAIFVGFQAGVASTLIDLEVNFEDLSTALTMDDAFEKLYSLKPVLKVLDQTEADTDLGTTAENE